MQFSECLSTRYVRHISQNFLLFFGRDIIFGTILKNAWDQNLVEFCPLMRKAEGIVLRYAEDMNDALFFNDPF